MIIGLTKENSAKHQAYKIGKGRMKKLIWVGVFLLLAGMSRAEVQFAPIFNDGTVVQCEMKVNVWGSADP